MKRNLNESFFSATLPSRPEAGGQPDDGTQWPSTFSGGCPALTMGAGRNGNSVARVFCFRQWRRPARPYCHSSAWWLATAHRPPSRWGPVFVVRQPRSLITPLRGRRHDCKIDRRRPRSIFARRQVWAPGRKLLDRAQGLPPRIGLLAQADAWSALKHLIEAAPLPGGQGSLPVPHGFRGAAGKVVRI